MTVAWSNISHSQRNGSSMIPFVHLELGEEIKEDSVKAGGSKGWARSQDGVPP